MEGIDSFTQMFGQSFVEDRGQTVHLQSVGVLFAGQPASAAHQVHNVGDDTIRSIIQPIKQVRVAV